MNREALRYKLDEKGVEYEEVVSGFWVYNWTLDNDLLGEINACGGAIITGSTESYFIRPKEEVSM
jgi:hypothetical protein